MQCTTNCSTRPTERTNLFNNVITNCHTSTEIYSSHNCYNNNMKIRDCSTCDGGFVVVFFLERRLQLPSSEGAKFVFIIIKRLINT